MKDQTTGASNEALFCIGSNCGDREGNVARALAWLSEILSDLRQSSVYVTPDCHGGQREYMNSVAVGYSVLDAAELESLCKDYEISCGRDSEARARGDVPVDVDLVGYAGEILRKKDYGCEFFLKGYREII